MERVSKSSYSDLKITENLEVIRMKILLVQPTLPHMRFEQRHADEIQEVCKNCDVVISDSVDKDADIIVCLSRIDAKEMVNLEWVHFLSAGVDRYLTEELANSPVLVTNSSGVHSIPVAEHVIGMIIALERKLHKAIINQSKRQWNREEFHDVKEMHGKTIGIVGLGRIGIRIAEVAKCLGLRVIATKKNLTKSEFVDELYPHAELDKLLKKSDYVVISVPLTKETRYLIGEEQFKKMKKSAYLINISRGEIVDENALVWALKNNIIAGACSDVFEKEPLAESSELYDLENVIITPHTAGWSPEYMNRAVQIFCENLKAFLKGERMPTLVDKGRGY